MRAKLENILNNINALVEEIDEMDSDINVLVCSYSENNLTKLVTKGRFDKANAMINLIGQWTLITRKINPYKNYTTDELISNLFFTSNFSEIFVSDIENPEIVLKGKIETGILNSNTKLEDIKPIEDFSKYEVISVKNEGLREVFIGVSSDFAFLYIDDICQDKPIYIKSTYNMCQHLAALEKEISKKNLNSQLYAALGCRELLMSLVRDLFNVYCIESMLLEILGNNSFKIQGNRKKNIIENNFSFLVIIYALSSSFEMKHNGIIFRKESNGNVLTRNYEDSSNCFDISFRFKDESLTFLKEIDYYDLFCSIREFIYLKDNGRVTLKDKENCNDIYSIQGLERLLIDDLEYWVLMRSKPIKLKFATDDIKVEICVLLSPVKANTKKSYVNCIRTYGGSHEEGLIKGVKNAFVELFSANRNSCIINKNYNTSMNILNWAFVGNDSDEMSDTNLVSEILEKMNYMVNIVTDKVDYKDNMKRIFHNIEIESYIKDMVSELLLNILKDEIMNGVN